MSDDVTKKVAIESVPYDMGNIAPTLRDDDELLDMGEEFNFDDFQVVRREFFAHLHEPSVSFNNCKFYVNSACLTRFPDSGYAQVLVNSSKKILALRPCNEGSRDSFMWCTDASKGKRKPKPITCKLFFAKIVELMGDLPRLELFARSKADGWDVWGNEVESDVQINIYPEKTGGVLCV